MNTKEFLQSVVTSSQPGWFVLAIGNGHGGWLEQWMKWPEDIDAIVERATAQADKANVYFSSYLFKQPSSLKENVLPSRTIQADLDDADVNNLTREPTILVETSPGRHQGYWILDEELPLEGHEATSKRLTYSIEQCDRSGWPLGRKVRVPGTKNHKYLTGPKEVRIVKSSERQYSSLEFEGLPEVNPAIVAHFDDNWIESPTGVSRNALELLNDIQDSIPVKVYIQYSVAQKDRSEALWALMRYAFKCGLTRDQVFTLAKDSANNKFADLNHRADQSLAKDVLRAELANNTGFQDPRQLISDIYKKPHSPRERKEMIFNVVLKHMRDNGEFLHATNGHAWYIRRDIGRPVALTRFGEALASLLDIQFGLNAVEPETRYVVEGLKAYVSSLPDTAIQSSLTYYDAERKHLLIHTGRKTVLKVTASSVEECIDGCYDIIFPWSQSTDVCTPQYAGDIDWGDELFGNGTRGFGSSVHNLTNMTDEQGIALLKVWFLFVLFRNIASSRPVLAMIGAPGSGKSVTFKKIYAALYGRHKSIGAVTSMDDFDHAVSREPFVGLDNVDTWEKWLPDRIALSAGTSDVVKRKLYSDSDTIVLKRQAILGVTAHNPKFGREDVADRFLLFTYQRLHHFISEGAILGDILSKRGRIWGAIIKDCQRVLDTAFPNDNEVPQFRIEDFAKIGLWMARAVGCEKDFRSSIGDVVTSQKAFSREEESLLVTVLMTFAEVNSKREGGPKPYTVSQLWGSLESLATDRRTFTNAYRNAVALSKKLSAMENSLKDVLDIQLAIDKLGIKMWLITKKQDQATQEKASGN